MAQMTLSVPRRVIQAVEEIAAQNNQSPEDFAENLLVSHVRSRMATQKEGRIKRVRTRLLAMTDEELAAIGVDRDDLS